jgi:hypothetical protein
MHTHHVRARVEDQLLPPVTEESAMSYDIPVLRRAMVWQTSASRLFILSLSLLIQIMLIQINSVLADDYISPELVKITTPQYRPVAAEFSPRLGVYEYSVGWEGINAASCSVTIDRRGDTYVVDAAARTYSGVDLLYKLRYEAVGTISARDLTSINLSIDHQENSRRKSIKIDFKPEQRAIHAVRSKGASDPDKKVLSFTTDNFTLDPIAAVFLARSLDWQVGDTKHFDVFNGKSRYFISLTAKERTTIRYKGELRPVIVITPQVRNLTTTKPRSKLRQASIYVSDDPQREVLRIESAVFIGRVITELDSFTPLAEVGEPPIQLVHSAEERGDMRAQMR